MQIASPHQYHHCVHVQFFDPPHVVAAIRPLLYLKQLLEPDTRTAEGLVDNVLHETLLAFPSCTSEVFVMFQKVVAVRADTTKKKALEQLKFRGLCEYGTAAQQLASGGAR